MRVRSKHVMSNVQTWNQSAVLFKTFKGERENKETIPIPIRIISKRPLWLLNFCHAQSVIEQQQLIDLYTWVPRIPVAVVSPDNYLTTRWRTSEYYVYGCVIRHFCSIKENPDSFSFIGSSIVHHNVGPSGGFGVDRAESFEVQNNTEAAKDVLKLIGGVLTI